MGSLLADVRSSNGWRLMEKKSVGVRKEINGEDVGWRGICLKGAKGDLLAEGLFIYSFEA